MKAKKNEWKNAAGRDKWRRKLGLWRHNWVMLDTMNGRQEKCQADEEQPNDGTP